MYPAWSYPITSCGDPSSRITLVKSRPPFAENPLDAMFPLANGCDVKSAGEQYRATASALDKSVQKGILHKNTASRYKSRLNARVKALAAKKSA